MTFFIPLVKTPLECSYGQGGAEDRPEGEQNPSQQAGRGQTGSQQTNIDKVGIKPGQNRKLEQRWVRGKAESATGKQITGKEVGLGCRVTAK